MRQPYQEATEAIKRQGEAPGQLVKGAAQAALGVAGGGAVLNRIVPFLSSFVPQDLAIKGISKINPTLGKFVQGSLNQGKSMEEVTDFLKEKAGIAEPKEEQKQAPKAPNGQPNLIEQFSPELHEFLVSEIGKGLIPEDAANQARSQPKFKQLIDKLEKSSGARFDNIVGLIFGGKKPQNQPQQAQQPQQPQAQPEQQQVQGGPATQALMQALQAAAAARQRRTK